MRKIVFIFVALFGSCNAQTRWCTVTGLGTGDKLFYPPIARYARVFGVVVSRVRYLPHSKVLSVEPIFGPNMLSESLEKQLLGWTVTTDAMGEAPCQSLVISEFRLSDEGNQTVVDPIDLTEPSTLRLGISSPTPPCLCDPSSTLTIKRSLLVRKFRSFFRRVFKRPIVSDL